MEKVVTVCGEIDACELGFTSMHEYTISHPSGLKRIMRKAVPGMLTGVFGYEGGQDLKEEQARRMEKGIKMPAMSVNGVLSSMKLKKGNPAVSLPMEEYYKREFMEYKKAGGRSLCDCSPQPVGFVDPGKIKALSECTGIHVVCGTGYYIDAAIGRKDRKPGVAGMQRKIGIRKVRIGDTDRLNLNSTLSKFVFAVIIENKEILGSAEIICENPADYGLLKDFLEQK